MKKQKRPRITHLTTERLCIPTGEGGNDRIVPIDDGNDRIVPIDEAPEWVKRKHLLLTMLEGQGTLPGIGHKGAGTNYIYAEDDDENQNK